MKRLILLMVASLLLATAMPALAQVPADVPADHWAVEAVRDLYNRGIFVGYPDDSFRGDRAITRYELAVALSRLLSKLPTDGTGDFVTRTELRNTLNNYPTKTELQTTLGNYPTKTELQTTLRNYVTMTEFERRLANLATKDDIARLQRLIDSLRTDLTALGVRVDDVQRRLAALETRVGSLEERVSRLEETPSTGTGALIFDMKGGVIARQASTTGVTPGAEDFLVNEYDRPLVDGFSSGAAFDIMAGVRLQGGLGVGARILAVNEDLTSANLNDFDTELGVFLSSGETRLSLGVFDAEFTPFTLANSSESILEQIPAFYNDWYFSGAKLETLLGPVRATALISRPRARDLGVPQYAQSLFAARAGLALSDSVNIMGNYVLVNDDEGDPIFIGMDTLSALRNRVWSVNADLVFGTLGLYGEFAESRLEDEIFGGTATGNAYKAGVVIGPIDAWYLKIGGVDEPFISYYGDPAAATLFNAHDPGMGRFLDPFVRALYFGQQPNLSADGVLSGRYDLNNNIRGYGITLSSNRSRSNFLDPVSPLLIRGAEDAAFRSALGYERLSQIDAATGEFIAPGTLTTVSDGVFQTILASLALDLSDSFILLGGFKQRKVTAAGIDVDTTTTPPAVTPFDIEATQNTTTLGLAYRFSADTILALQHFIVDYTDNIPELDSTAHITKATLSVKF